MPIESIVLLFIAACFAGFVDSIAGGGGLITIPSLIFSGVPPVLALGTNKLQGFAGSFSASLHFFRKGYISLKRMRWMMLLTLIGASLGSYAILQLDNALLMILLPFALIGLALYTFFSKSVGDVETEAKLTDKQFALRAGTSIGFYDGFFGPGTGTFFAMSFVKLLGMDFVKATGHAKVLNCVANIVALTVFIIGGKVLFLIGGIMAIGQFIGARIGASIVIKRGSRFIRTVTILVCIAISISLLLQQFTENIQV